MRTGGQKTPDELIDRYQLTCRPVRDLLVDYLQERQPGLDYNSLRALAYYLGNRFWKDLELHHPDLDSLHLPVEVAAAWRQRLLTQPKTVMTKDGQKSVVSVPRVSYGQCLTSVRSFYLDLSQWAIEDPARWAHWVVPCPVSQDEIGNRKFVRRRKARMDARTRERLPVLPVLVRTVDRRRKTAEELLQAARQAELGDTFTAAGQTLTRSFTTTGGPQDLGGRSSRRQAPRPLARGGVRVLGMGRGGSPSIHGHPDRGAFGDRSPQPGAIPAADHR